MAWSVLQSTSNFNATSGTTVAQPFGSNVVAGNSLICVGCWISSATATAAVTDSQGNTWTPIATTLATLSTGAVARSQIFVATAGSSAACTVTLTSSASVAERTVGLIEVSGLAGTTSGVVATSGSATNPSANITVSDAASLIVGGGFNGGTATQGTGYTLIGSADGNPSEYKLAGATGSVAVSFTATGGNYTISAAEFLISGGAPAPPPILVMAPPLPST